MDQGRSRVEDLLRYMAWGAARGGSEGPFHVSVDTGIDPDLFGIVVERAREAGARLVSVEGYGEHRIEVLLDTASRFPDMVIMPSMDGGSMSGESAARIASTGNVWPAILTHGTLASEAMGLLSAAGAIFGFAAIVDRETADEIASEGYVDRWASAGARFGRIVQRRPSGADPDVSVLATASQRDQVRRRLRDWQKHGAVPVADPCMDGSCTGGCMAAGMTCHVAATGLIQPCAAVPFSAGSIREAGLARAFDSDLFRRVRSMLPCDTNLLRPCMVVDHPDLLRTIVDQCEPMPTSVGADTIVLKMDVRRKLDAYAREWAMIAEEAWRGPDYRSGRSVTLPLVGRVDVRDAFPGRMAQADLVTAMRKSMGDGFYPKPVVRMPVPVVEAVRLPGAAA